MEQPLFKLIGDPRKVRAKKKETANHYQFYALLSAPKKRLRAPCCHDFKVSKQQAIAFVNAHIKKSLMKSGTVAAFADHTLEQHIATYKEHLESAEDVTKHARQTISRIRCVCKGLGWKKIDDIDGLKMKTWLKKRKGIEATTRGYYASSFKSFTKFLTEHQRIERDPLVYLKTSQKGDKAEPSRIRRALTVDEMGRLIRAAETSKAIKMRLNGEQRAWLYRLAVSVGFRAHELSSLTPLSFSLDECCVLLERKVSKRRRYDRVELHPSLLDGLRDWLAGKKVEAKLWPGCWWNKAAEMLRHDLTVAGIPEIDDAGHVVDFHALRVTFVTNLVGTNAPVALVQRIARLSTPALLARYYKPHDAARREAIEAMPSLLPS